MDKPSPSDIASFPELFAGLELFFDEQIAGLKRTGGLVAGIALSGGMLTFYLLEKLA